MNELHVEVPILERSQGEKKRFNYVVAEGSQLLDTNSLSKAFVDITEGI